MNANNDEKQNSGLLKTVLESLAAPGTTFWRALSAAVVIAVTFWMTLRDAKIPVEWETVFLVVIGYYFKDRPLEEEMQRNPAILRSRPGSPGIPTQETVGVIGEMTYQFLLATLLVLGAAAAFLVPAPKPSIPASWIGAVVLAVGFYFKESPIGTLELTHERFRLLVALEVVAVTVPLVVLLVAKTKGETSVPVQWAGVVLIVVTFYFKERKPGISSGPERSPRTL